jgi:pimeloyl-ACP methyl ester carboxylesterase
LRARFDWVSKRVATPAEDQQRDPGRLPPAQVPPDVGDVALRWRALGAGASSPARALRPLAAFSRILLSSVRNRGAGAANSGREALGSWRPLIENGSLCPDVRMVFHARRRHLPASNQLVDNKGARRKRAFLWATGRGEQSPSELLPALWKVGKGTVAVLQSFEEFLESIRKINFERARMTDRADVLHGPGLRLQLLEVRALWEHCAALVLRPTWAAASKGDGHPVMVLPGLATGDGSTAIMRRFLRSRGYAAVGWGQGINRGPRPGVLESAHETLRGLRGEHGRGVSLIGWSLGGIYARELAKQSPELVRLVITLGSPFTGHPRETNAWRLYELTSGHRIGAEDIPQHLKTAPPVPTTSIWSVTDGIVSWRCSVETRRDLAENIVVGSSHLGLGAHPAALYAIADRLAQAEGEWAPFHRRGWRGRVYSDPAKVRAARAGQTFCHTD